MSIKAPLSQKRQADPISSSCALGRDKKVAKRVSPSAKAQNRQNLETSPAPYVLGPAGDHSLGEFVAAWGRLPADLLPVQTTPRRMNLFLDDNPT